MQTCSRSMSLEDSTARLFDICHGANAAHLRRMIPQALLVVCHSTTQDKSEAEQHKLAGFVDVSGPKIGNSTDHQLAPDPRGCACQGVHPPATRWVLPVSCDGHAASLNLETCATKASSNQAVVNLCQQAAVMMIMPVSSPCWDRNCASLLSMLFGSEVTQQPLSQ